MQVVNLDKLARLRNQAAHAGDDQIEARQSQKLAIGIIESIPPKRSLFFQRGGAAFVSP